MKTIAFVTQKGGSGKSTLCIGLAVAARLAGNTVSIIDTDRQGTIIDWSTLRHHEPPEVLRADAAQLEMVLERLVGDGCDYAFVDTPGAIGAETLAAIAAADICVVPTRPTPADLRVIRPTLAAIYRNEKPFAFVLNQTPPQSYRVRDAAEDLVALGILPGVNVVLRNDHQDALGAGLGVSEHNPTGKAAHEICALWRWTADRLGADTRRQNRNHDVAEIQSRAA